MNLSFKDTKNISLKTKVILLWLGNIYSDIKFYRKKTCIQQPCCNCLVVVPGQATFAPLGTVLLLALV